MAGRPQPEHEQVPDAPSSNAPRARAPREQFEAGELAIVCSRYDAGIIESVHEYARGSRKAPKVLLTTNTGRYILKRRAPGRDNPRRVAFSHDLQTHLLRRKFPLPRLVQPRGSDESMVRIGDHIYELFEHVPGTRYDLSLEATGQAGRALAHFHRALADFPIQNGEASTGTYHNARGLSAQLDRIPASTEDAMLRPLAERLGVYYAEASGHVESLGIAGWPEQVIHADWHPGNMLFDGPGITAVLDFDSARVAPRVIDIANGALQFSITMQGEDPGNWPAALDEGRLKRFCRSYDSVDGCIISTAECDAVPRLMIEALIVEATVPIAATGSFAGISGGAFLDMVDRKVTWLREHAHRLSRLISG